MIKIKEYNEKYDSQLKQLDPITYYTIKHHKDVLGGSICVAVSGSELVGAGFLKAGPTFLKVNERDLPYYHIHAEFVANESAKVESQVMASELLVEELKKKYEELCDQYPGKRLILRLWCNAARTAYQEFLMAHGFRVMRTSPILVRELTEAGIPLENSLEIRELDPFDDRIMEAYTLVNREAFEVEDSVEELRFVMKGEDSHLFGVMKGDDLVAAASTWKITEERAATENIFCASEYRRRGITSALLQYVFGFLKKRGYGQASLTLFGDNQPAFQLYYKLGYELEGNMLEMHYEPDYVGKGY